MIEIDEGGVSGAAYTEIRMVGAAPSKITEKLTFMADRPFIHAVTGPEGTFSYGGMQRTGMADKKIFCIRKHDKEQRPVGIYIRC